MKNIASVQECFGCGVCAVACPRKVISIRLSKDGFYQPYIDAPNHCINCSICLDVCAYSHVDLSLSTNPLVNYAAWSREVAVRRKCSSGGIGFEIGRSLIHKGYKVCGVRYNIKTNCAEHYIATTVEELIPSIGSKYIQSYTVDGFKVIDRKEKYLITGTPCQIDSFRRYIRRFHCEDNFVLMDFFCHSVPSMHIWNNYVRYAERKLGKLTYVSWRNKFTGWHDSWAMSIDGERTGCRVDWHDSYNLLMREKKGSLNSRLSKGDIFYKLFLGDYYCNPACRRNCKYKYDKSSADIRIGDLWGKTYKDNEDGVSAVVAFTEKGKVILKDINCVFIEHPFEIVAEGQMKRNCGEACLTPIVQPLLRDGITLPVQGWVILFKMESILKRIKSVVIHMIGILNKIGKRKNICFCV